MRQVQVFKWIQERDGDGKLQNVRTQDGMATFHQFGAAYEEFENGAGSYTIAIIERADGSVQQVNADMIQFIPPPEDVVPADIAALRDRFAGLAMAAMIDAGKERYEDIPNFAYGFADSLLAERAK